MNKLIYKITEKIKTENRKRNFIDILLYETIQFFEFPHGSYLSFYSKLNKEPEFITTLTKDNYISNKLKFLPEKDPAKNRSIEQELLHKGLIVKESWNNELYWNIPNQLYLQSIDNSSLKSSKISNFETINKKEFKKFIGEHFYNKNFIDAILKRYEDCKNTHNKKFKDKNRFPDLEEIFKISNLETNYKKYEDFLIIPVFLQANLKFGNHILPRNYIGGIFCFKLKNKDELPPKWEKNIGYLIKFYLIIVRYIHRVKDEDRWAEIFRELGQIKASNFEEIFKNILVPMSKLGVVFSSYWAHFEQNNIEKKENLSFLVKKSSQKNLPDNNVEQFSFLEEPVVSMEGEKCSVVDFSVKIKNSLNEKNKIEADYFLGFKNPEQGQDEFILKNIDENKKGIFELLETDKGFIIPIKSNKGPLKEAQSLRGILTIFPHSNKKNLLLFSKEKINALATHINQQIEKNIEITKNKITEAIISIANKNIPELNFNTFINSSIQYIKENLIQVDGHSIFFYNEANTTLDVFGTTGLIDKNKNPVRERDYSKIYYSKEEDSDSNTWKVFEGSKAHKDYSSKEWFEINRKNLKFQETSDSSSEDKMTSNLILPIIFPGTENIPNIGVLRLYNLRSWLDNPGKEIIPFPDDIIEILEHFAQLLGVHYLAYKNQKPESSTNFFRVLPHEIGNYFKDVGEKIKGLEKSIESAPNQNSELNHSFDELKSSLRVLKFKTITTANLLSNMSTRFNKVSVVDFIKEFSSLLNRYEKKLKKNGFKLIIDKQSLNSLPEFNCARPYIEKLIDEFLDNAMYYSFEGTKIKLYGEIKNNTPRIIVENIGIGFAGEEDKIMVFSSRSEQGKVKRISGMGAGLYLVQRIIEEHQWDKIIAKSTEKYSQNFPLWHGLNLIGENNLESFVVKDIDFKKNIKILKNKPNIIKEYMVPEEESEIYLTLLKKKFDNEEWNLKFLHSELNKKTYFNKFIITLGKI
jgi:hypothetical protein